MKTLTTNMQIITKHYIHKYKNKIRLFYFQISKIKTINSHYTLIIQQFFPKILGKKKLSIFFYKLKHI